MVEFAPPALARRRFLFDNTFVKRSTPHILSNETGGVSETWALGIGFVIVLVAYLIGQLL